MKYFLFTLFFFLSLGHLYGSSDNFIELTIDPIRVVRDVHPERSNSEEVLRLERAQVVIADYDLIRRDFPQISHLANPEIDNWLLNQAAFVSKGQVSQEVVNSQIPVSSEVREAWRPPNYGRAHVFEATSPVTGEPIGLIDAKGTGAIRPMQLDHANGVATLGESIREFLYENLMRRIFQDAELPQRTVGSYAVIDAGFDVIHPDGSSSPAGLYLRQGHDRVVDHPGAWLPEEKVLKLQAVFRRYGIDPNLNIQGTRNHLGIFDFGHYVVKDHLDELDPAKAIPFDVWGYDKNITPTGQDIYKNWFYSKLDNPWNWSHELAEGLREGRADRHSAWLHLRNMLSPVEEKLQLNLSSSSRQGCADLVSGIIGQ